MTTEERVERMREFEAAFASLEEKGWVVHRLLYDAEEDTPFCASVHMRYERPKDTSKYII